MKLRRFYKFLKTLRYLLEAVITYPVYGFSWLLPVSAASGFGALIGDAFYYLHSGTRRARRNLQRVMPERAAEHEEIIRGMWRNFGRVFMEYPHLEKMWKSGRVSVTGQENVENNKGQPCVLVAAHLANWELGPLIARKYGWRMAAIYRPLNNTLIDPLLRYARRADNELLFPKSPEGAMALMRYVRGGGNAGLLMDQRLTGGVEVPFFGIPAMAPPTAALLAIKYNAVLLPVRVERLGGAKQRVTVYPAPSLPTEGTEAERIAALTADIYKLFEEWIRARPEQWLWMHDRWRLNRNG